jgi:hypothetical protein
VEISGTTFTLEDATVAPPRLLALDDLGLLLEGLVLGLPEGAAAEPAALRLHLALEGLVEELQLEGSVVAQPGLFDLETDLVLAVRGIDGEALAPFVGPLGVEPLLRSGELGLALRARLFEPEAGLWRADAELADLRLADGERSWLSLGRLAIEGASSDGERLQVELVAVERPEARIVHDAEGGLRVAGVRIAPPSDPGASPSGPSPAAPPAEPPTLPDLTGLPPFELTELRVAGVRLSVRDEVPPTPLDAELTLDLGLGSLNTEGRPVRIGVRAGVVDLVEAVELETEVRLGEERIELDGRFGARGLDPEGLAPYLPAGLTLETGAGRLDGRLALGLSEAEAGGLAARVELGELRWGEPEAPAWLEVGRLALEGRRLDPAAERFELGELRLAGTRLRAVREADGSLRALGLRLAPPTPQEEPAADDGAPTDPVPTAAPAPVPPPTLVLLEGLELELERLEFQDRAADPEPAEVAGGVRLRVEPGLLLDGTPEDLPPVEWSVEGHLEGVVDQLRLAARSAPFATQPRAALELAVTGLSTRALAERVPALGALAEGELEAAELHARLESSLEVQRTRPYELALQRPFSGSVLLSELRLLDGPGGEVLLGLDEVQADLARIDLATGRIHLESVELETPRAVASRGPEGLRAAGFLWRPQEGEAPPTAEAVAAPASSPAAEPGDSGELRIDTLYIGGLDARVTDAAVTPPLELTLSDLDLEVRRFTTRALVEPRPISYRAFLAAGGDSPLFEDLTTRGRVTLYPRLEGWGRSELNGLELPLLSGYTSPSGVELRGGTLRVVSSTKLTGERLGVSTQLRFEELSIHEESGGPIERALKLPMNLNNALFLTRSPDGTHRIGIDLSLTPEGLSYRELLRQATSAIALFFTQALAGAPVRLLTSVSPLDMSRREREPLEVLEVEFRPGRTRPDDAILAELNRIGRRLADRPDLQARVTYEPGEGDDAEAERLANPPDEECLELVHQLRQRRAELWRAIGERKLEARALFAIGSDEAMDEVTALRGMERKLAEIEQGLERVLAVLDADSERQRQRRTRRVIGELAELRMQEVQRGLQRRMKVYQYGQIERTPIRLREPAEGRPGRVRVELRIP